MLDFLTQSVLYSSNASVTVPQYLECAAVSIVLGLAIGVIYMYRKSHSRDFVITLALLPVIVQSIIMMVNGNMGVGLAVLGAFSLVRFRSIAGTSRDITSIFLAMAAGLITGLGYLAMAVIFVVIVGLLNVVLIRFGWGEGTTNERQLKVSIPESLDYQEVFDDIFAKYLAHWDLDSVRTSNMGSLYQLCYRVTLKPDADSRAFMDELRRRNGNMEVALGRNLYGKDQL